MYNQTPVQCAVPQVVKTMWNLEDPTHSIRSKAYFLVREQTAPPLAASSKHLPTQPLRPPALSDSQEIGAYADRARRGWVGKCLEDAGGCCPFSY